MNPTMTLAQIRRARLSPSDSLWRRLLAGLGYADGQYDPETQVSLGDIAMATDASEALMCIGALDWSDVVVRRAVIAGAVLPTVRRAVAHTTDKRVHDCLGSVARWCDGDETVDLREAAEAAWAAAAKAERGRQRADIIAAFAPLALADGGPR